MTGSVLLATVAAAVAVWLLFPVRARRGRRDWGSIAWTDPMERLVRGRDGGLGARFRTAVTVPSGAVLLCVVVVVGGPLWLVLPVVGVVVVAAWVGLGWIESDAHRERRQRVAADLPQVCDLLACCLEAGLPLRRAVEVVAGACRGPVAEDLGRLIDLVRVGEPEAAAWRALAAQPVWQRLAVDLARSVESGSEVADAVRHHAELARQDTQQEQETRARAAGVRSVLPLTVCFLPAFFLIGVVPIVAGLVAGLLQ